jgi:hypothetical protein
MTRYWKYFAMAVLGLAICVPAASAHPHVFIGGSFGPWFYGPGYYGWYGPGYYYGPYAEMPNPNVGKVKFDTKRKEAGVYIDDAYAGTVRQLGTFALRPGDHNIELRDASGQTIFQEHINVVVGKTIKLAA